MIGSGPCFEFLVTGAGYGVFLSLFMLYKAAKMKDSALGNGIMQRFASLC